MLMVLDGVTAWLKHHQSWPPSLCQVAQGKDQQYGLDTQEQCQASPHTAARLAYVGDLLDLAELNSRWVYRFSTGSEQRQCG